MAANRICSAIWLAALTAASMADEAARAEGPQRNDDSVHVAFCAECTSDMDWKSAALFASFASSGMRGQITRLLACSDLQLASYPPEALRMGPTYVHRNYRTHPRVPGDNSGSYNKAASIMHFVQDVAFDETFVLYIDADMLIRRPIVPSALGARQGVVVSEHVQYLENGVNNGLVAQFSPDAKGTPAPVGWVHLFHRADISKIAPLWLHYCERVRTEPERYWSQYGLIAKDIPTGDAFVGKGGIPWIAEMYGYVIAAAEIGVSHVLTHGVVKYAEWPNDHSDKQDWIADPYIIHNGIGCAVPPSYRFDKGGVRVDTTKACAPELPADSVMRYVRRRVHIHYLPQASRPPAMLDSAGRTRPFSQQLCIWATNVLNNALCGLYRVQCRSEELCPVEYFAADGRPAVGAWLPPVSEQTGVHECVDSDQAACPGWAHEGACRDSRAAVMAQTCAKSCGLCVHVSALDPSPERAFNGSQLGHFLVPRRADAPTEDEARAPVAPAVLKRREAAAGATAGGAVRAATPPTVDAATTAAAAAAASEKATAMAVTDAAAAAAAIAAARATPAVATATAPAVTAAAPAESGTVPRQGRIVAVANNARAAADVAASSARAEHGTAVEAARAAVDAAAVAARAAHDAAADHTHWREIMTAAVQAVTHDANRARDDLAASAPAPASATATLPYAAAGGAADGGAVDMAAAVRTEATVTHIKTQLALMWAALLCGCGSCLGVRIVQVAIQRRARARKRRDSTGKGAV